MKRMKVFEGSKAYKAMEVKREEKRKEGNGREERTKAW